MKSKQNIVYCCENIDQFEYTVRKSRNAKRARLTVYCDGRVVATMPQRMPVSYIEEFINSKSQWIIGKIQEFKNRQQSLLTDNKPGEYQRLKFQARQLVVAKLTHFNQFYQLQYNRIAIRNQKTRWGSCSSNGNLNFNYKVVHLPEELQNYIVVHELCHLQEMNHSYRFWNLMAKIIPNCRELSKRIRKM